MNKIEFFNFPDLLERNGSVQFIDEFQWEQGRLAPLSVLAQRMARVAYLNNVNKIKAVFVLIYEGNLNIKEDSMAEEKKAEEKKEEKKRTEEFKLNGSQVVDKIKELIHEGNIRRIILKNNEGETLIEIPLTLGLVGVALMPVLAAVGAIAALVAKMTIVVEKVED